MATPSHSTVINQINTYIVANGNNEITANVLNPILEIITDFANNHMGDLSTLTTDETDNLVAAINSLKQNIQDISVNGVQLHIGNANPNDSPPPSYNYADFYMQVSPLDNEPIQLWQFDGFIWTADESTGTFKLPYSIATEGQTIISVPEDLISVDLVINQVPQNEGVGLEYTFAPGIITMYYPLTEGDSINIRGYRKIGAIPETTVLEENVYGTALYNASMTGSINVDISTFSTLAANLTGNTSITLTGLPIAGKSIVKTMLIASSTNETFEIANATYTVGEFTNDGTWHRVTIEASNYPTLGSVITITYENLEA